VPQEILLDITGYDIPHWTGAVNGNWDIDDGTGTVGTLNWALSGGGSTGYYQGGAVGTDSVLFDNTATGTKTVNLTTTLTPIAVTVNNDNLTGDTYTFTGTGKLSGATTLTKLGNGTLILANTGGNDFTGTVNLNGGVLQAGDGVTAGAGQLGSGQINLNGGTLALDHPSGDNVTLPNILTSTGTLTQQGADTVTVTGNNLGFSGVIDVNSGTLKLGSTNGFGTASISVQSGANLDITGYTVANALGFGGGTLESISGSGTSVTGPVTLNGGGVVSVAASSTLNISGAIGGAGGLVSSGSGLLILSGNNTYSGTTTVNAGTLQVGNSNALGSSSDPTSIASGAILDLAGYAVPEPIQFNGGTLRSSTGIGGTVSGIVTVGASGGTVDVPTGITLTLSNSVNGGGLLTKSSAGTLILSGSNSYSGGLALNAGEVEFANAAAVPATGQVSLANGITLAFGFDFDQTLLNNAIASTFNTATIALAANDTHDLNFANFAGVSLGAIGNVTYSGTLTPAFVNYYLGGGGGTLTFTSALTGGTNLIVGATGSSTVILTAANSFSGGTTVTAGTLRLGNSAALGLATDPATVNGTLDLNGYNLTVGSLAGTGLVTDNSSTPGTTLLTVNVAGADTYSGSINNGANGRSITLVKQGAGSLLFNKGNGSNYSGGTVINGGTLEVRTNNAQVLPLGSDLTFTGTSLFRSGNNGTGAANLTLGTLTFSAGEGTVQSDQESTGTTGTLTFAAAPTRLAGATGNFTLLVATDPSKYKVVFNTVPATGQSLDGGIFFQGSDFAAYDPTGHYVRALSYGTDSNTVNVALTSSQASLGTITGKDVELDGTGSITDQGTDSARTLKIAGANNLTLDPAATFTVSAGGILKTGGNAATISGGVELDTGGEGDLVVRTATATDILTIATTISSETADGVTASGSGTVILSGSNSFTGPVNVLGGVLELGSTGGFGTSPDAVIVQSGAVVDLTTFNTGKTIQIDSATLRSSTGTTGDATGAVVLNGGGTLDVGTGATLNVDGIISGSGTLTKTSLGTAKLTAANPFTGNITITSGTILITNSQALGIGPKTVSIANILRPALAIDGSGGNVSLDPSISFFTSSDGTLNTLGAIINVAGNNVINGSINLNNGGGGNTDIYAQGGTLTLAGTISVAAGSTATRGLVLDGPANGTVSGTLSDGAQLLSLTKQGSGTWLVTGNNTYNGGTVVSAGTLQVNSFATSGQPQPLGESTAPIALGTATTAGTLEYTGTTATTLFTGVTVNGVGGGIIKNSGGALLTVSGPLSTTGRPLTLTGGAFDVTGAITGPAANSSLTVSNAIVTLAGTSNTYNGPTTVTNGTLIVSGSINGTTSLAVNSGGVLGGNGSITTTNGNVTVASGGILAPGNDAPLNLSLGTGVLDLSAAAGGTGYLQFELGVNSDEILLNSGSLNIGSGLLGLNDFSFTNAGGFAPGTYVLFSSPNAISGTLGSNLGGQVLGLNASLSIGGASLNSLVLNVVPEPGTAPAVVAGLSALLGLQRFRRRSRAHRNFTK
jgi:autotransporter-associated beta strand protein